MLLFFEVLCAYFAAIGLFFLIREGYYCLTEDKKADRYVCVYVAREDESEEEARRLLESEELSGRVFVIYGDDKQTEKYITDLCIRHGKLYIKK
jgi:hypothetical protein